MERPILSYSCELLARFFKCKYKRRCAHEKCRVNEELSIKNLTRLKADSEGRAAWVALSHVLMEMIQRTS